MTTLVFLESIVGEPHFFLIIPTSAIELLSESCSFSSAMLRAYPRQELRRASSKMFVNICINISHYLSVFVSASVKQVDLIHAESNVGAPHLFVSCSCLRASGAAPSLSTTNYLGNQALVVLHRVLEVLHTAPSR